MKSPCPSPEAQKESCHYSDYESTVVKSALAQDELHQTNPIRLYYLGCRATPEKDDHQLEDSEKVDHQLEDSEKEVQQLEDSEKEVQQLEESEKELH